MSRIDRQALAGAQQHSGDVLVRVQRVVGVEQDVSDGAPVRARQEAEARRVRVEVAEIPDLRVLAAQLMEHIGLEFGVVRAVREIVVRILPWRSNVGYAVVLTPNVAEKRDRKLAPELAREGAQRTVNPVGEHQSFHRSNSSRYCTAKPMTLAKVFFAGCHSVSTHLPFSLRW